MNVRARKLPANSAHTHNTSETHALCLLAANCHAENNVYNHILYSFGVKFIIITQCFVHKFLFKYCTQTCLVQSCCRHKKSLGKLLSDTTLS